jgi:transposase
MAYKVIKRKTKYGTQLSIVNHVAGKSIYIKTIGTAKDATQLVELHSKATLQINSLEGNLWSILNNEKASAEPIRLKGHRVEKTLLNVLYTSLGAHFDSVIQDPICKLFRDLCILRITNPLSKKESVEQLKELFDLEYSLDQIYYLKKKLKESKDILTKQIVQALSGGDFHLVFYDVTTVYFESFTEDDLRKCGFSKDNKFNQPQLVIGLLVNIHGIPLDYEVYPGNKFEGHTFIPSIKSFIQKYSIGELTVVADAAMMSKITFQELKDAGLKYIIGARLGNLKSHTFIKLIEKFKKINNETIRMDDLVVHYSATRARKDRSDRLKQIEKAKRFMLKPLKKNLKFLIKKGFDNFEMNMDMIRKAEALEGLKGYYTNLNIPNNNIVETYSNLWKIEYNFRVTKSDLALRPIYHYKEDGIKLHLLICFVALAVSRKIEIEHHCSIKRFVHDKSKEKEVHFRNLSTNQVFIV